MVRKSLISSLFLGLSALTFFSCNDENSKKTVRAGKLAQEISGLTVISGSTEGESSDTGSFFYEEGRLAEFYVGGLKLGNGVQGSIALDLDSLFTDGVNDHRFQKAVQVLSVLDENLNVSDGIRILSSTLRDVNEELEDINLSANDSDFEIQYANLVNELEAINKDTVVLDREEALIAFQKWEINTYIDDQMSLKSLPGVCLSIELPNGETYHVSKGLANKESGDELSNDHQFRIGSATKSFVGLTIMQLVQEDKIKLDDTVEKYFPGKFPNGEMITVQNLIRHTAGIFSFTSESPGFYDYIGLDVSKEIDDLWFIRYMIYPTSIYTSAELIEIGSVAANVYVPTTTNPYLINEPGKAWNYSNTHYVMLADIIEQVTNNTWEDEVRTRFIDVLGLESTTAPLTGDSSLAGTYASGYINWVDNIGPDALAFGLSDSDIDRSITEPSLTGGSGAMTASSKDLLRWANAVMEGELLDEETQALMMEGYEFSALSTDGEMLHGVVHDKTNKMFGHRGQIVGYDASWQYRYEDVDDIIGTGTAISVLINRTLLVEAGHISNANEVILYGVLDILYGNNATSSKKSKNASLKKNHKKASKIKGHLNEY